MTQAGNRLIIERLAELTRITGVRNRGRHSYRKHCLASGIQGWTIGRGRHFLESQ